MGVIEYSLVFFKELNQNAKEQWVSPKMHELNLNGGLLSSIPLQSDGSDSKKIWLNLNEWVLLV